MPNFYSGLLLFAIVSALASSAGAAESSSFAELKARYTHAHWPTSMQAYGWRSGRCYSKADPNTPYASFAIGYFSGGTFKFGNLLDLDVEPENMFDHLTPELTQQILGMIKEDDVSLVTHSSPADRALVTEVDQIPGPVTVRTRVNETELLSEFTSRDGKEAICVYSTRLR